MKKLTVLTFVLLLSACGGGSGDKGANGPVGIETPNSIGNPNITEQVRMANAAVSSSFSNEEKRKAVALNNYEAAGVNLPSVTELNRGQDAQSTNNTQNRQATLRTMNAKTTSVQSLDNVLLDLMYENMNYWLVEGHTPHTVAGWIQYKHALILAGFIGFNLQAENLEEEITNHFINDTDIKDDIASQATNLFTELGTLKTFDGTNIEWFSSPDSTIENSTIDIHDKITFQIDPTNKKVIGINYIANDGSVSRQRTINMTRPNDSKNEYIANNVRIYSYGLNNIEVVGDRIYDPSAHDSTPEGRTLSISVTEPLTTLAELKEKLLAEIELAYEEGYFDSFHNFAYGETQEEISLKLKNEAIRRVNNWENEEPGGKIEEFDVFDVQNNLTTFGHLVGLAYSDFGTMDIIMTGHDDNEPHYDSKIIYGGYKDKRISPENIATNMEFHGVAKGQVYASVTKNHVDETIIEYDPLALQDNNARLVFNPTNQTETLTASFADNDWYDIEIVKNSTNKPRITFTDNTTTDNTTTIADEYRLIGHTSGKTYTVEDFTKTTTDLDYIHYDQEQGKIVSGGDGVTGGASGTFGIAYYGENQKPSEAVGYITYNESEPFEVSNEDDRIKNVGFELGFGMQKDLTNQ